MWGRWSSTLGLRVYSSRAYAYHLNFEFKRKGVLNNLESIGPRNYNLYFIYTPTMTLAEVNTFTENSDRMTRGINWNDTMCTLPYPRFLILLEVLKAKAARRTHPRVQKTQKIRAKLDLVLPWFQKGTTLVLTRLSRAHTLLLYFNLIALRWERSG